MRGTSTFWTHHFKCEVESMMKNKSWQFGVIDLVKMEHSHLYHTKNSQGRPRQYTAPVGGHFHEVTVSEDEDGNLVGKCGPALHEVYKKLKNGKMKKTVEPVSWYDAEREMFLKDDHSHKITYIDSENLSPDKIKRMQQQNQSGIENFNTPRFDNFEI